MVGYQRHHNVQMIVGAHFHTKSERQRWAFGQNKGMPWRAQEDSLPYQSL